MPGLIYGKFNTNPETVGSGQDTVIQTDPQGRVLTAGAGTAGATAGGVFTFQAPEDGVTLTKSSVTMSGVSAVLVAADATRKIVIVSSAETNAAAAIDPTGGTCALDAGLAVPAGTTGLEITGKAAQSAMTQFGTNTQKLTVYTG